MPVYFIHFSNADQLYEDLEGVDLPDDAAAHQYAVLDARYLMDEGITPHCEWPVWRVEVVNEAGRQLLSLSFSDLVAQTH